MKIGYEVCEEGGRFCEEYANLAKALEYHPYRGWAYINRYITLRGKRIFEVRLYGRFADVITEWNRTEEQIERNIILVEKFGWINLLSGKRRPVDYTYEWTEKELHPQYNPIQFHSGIGPPDEGDPLF